MQDKFKPYFSVERPIENITIQTAARIRSVAYDKLPGVSHYHKSRMKFFGSAALPCQIKLVTTGEVRAFHEMIDEPLTMDTVDDLGEFLLDELDDSYDSHAAISIDPLEIYHPRVDQKGHTSILGLAVDNSFLWEQRRGVQQAISDYYEMGYPVDSMWAERSGFQLLVPLIQLKSHDSERALKAVQNELILRHTLPAMLQLGPVYIDDEIPNVSR